MSEVYYGDYPKERLKDQHNPYYCCVHCGRSDPRINGRLEGHAEDCKYRLEKEAKLTQWIKIKAWHGGLYDDKKFHPLAQDMNNIANPLVQGYEWEFNGTLSEFVNKWNHKFMAFPVEKDVDTEEYKYSHDIFITQHGSFNQR